MPKSMMSRATGMIACAVLLSSPWAVNAEFSAPTWRGDADTTYQEWNNFTDATGPNAPDVADINAYGMAIAQNKSDGGFLVGGNIYSPTDPPLEIEVFVPEAGHGTGNTTLWLQVRTRGTELDPDSLILIPEGGSSLVFDTSEELGREALGGFGGSQVDTLFTWVVAGNASSYTFQFNALGTSMSLDRLSVDTRFVAGAAAVPEPATLVSTALGALIVVGGCFRSRSRSRRNGPKGSTRETNG